MATGKAAALPAQYAKFITALAGVAIAYLTAYGTTWNLQGFLVSAGAALAVFGVPNAAPPAPPATVTLPSNVKVYSPPSGPPEPVQPPPGPAGPSS